MPFYRMWTEELLPPFAKVNQGPGLPLWTCACLILLLAVVIESSRQPRLNAEGGIVQVCSYVLQ